MRTGFAAALALAALTAGCGGNDGDPEPEPTSIADFFEVGAEDCGLERRPPSLAAVESAPTLAEQVRRLTGVVSRLREVQVDEEPPTTFIDRDELERRLRDLLLEEYPADEAETDERALVLLGAIRPGLDLRETLIEAAGDAIGGYFDPDEGRVFVVREEDGELSELDLEILGHELVHALTYSRLGREEGEPSDGWGDTELGIAGLVEGDATVAEMRLTNSLQGLPANLLDELPADALVDVPGLPAYLAYAFVFPYVEGVGLACTLFAEGGWAAVDEAYRDPPGSSAEVMFPELYLEGWEPERPSAPAGPGAGWRRASATSGVFGAADLVSLFGAPGDNSGYALDDPVGRAADWGGGRLDLWTSGRRSALALTLVDRDGDRSLCGSMTAWLAAALRSPTAPHGSLRCRGATVLVALADDPLALPPLLEQGGTD